MKNEWPVFAIIIVVSLLIVINSNNIYWYLSLSQIDQSKMEHGQREKARYGEYAPVMKQIKYIDDNSIEITFGSTGALDYIPNDFEFTKIVHKGDAFIAFCDPDTKTSATLGTMIIYKLTAINSTLPVFDQYGTAMPKELCKYPDVIKYSFDIPWKLPPSTK